MARRKPKAKPLPRAVTERNPFLSGFDDLILDNREIVIMPAAVTKVDYRRFSDHVLSLIPKADWVAFTLGDSVHVCPKQEAFLDALMEIWPRLDDLEPELSAIGNRLLHEFIRLLKGRGLIGPAMKKLGFVFGPVTP